MNTTRFSLALTGILAATLVLTACSSDESMGGMNHESSTPSSSASEVAANFNDADVTFASGMVMHHQQAIGMADMFLEKEGADERVAALAEKIKAAQQPEIDLMNEWLTAWGEPAESMEGHDMSEMSGGMSEEDMNALMDATGAEADRLFLTQMTAHHMGAIDMANEEIDAGENPDALELAEKIVSDQTAEIEEMNALLETL